MTRTMRNLIMTAAIALGTAGLSAGPASAVEVYLSKGAVFTTEGRLDLTSANEAASQTHRLQLDAGSRATVKNTEHTVTVAFIERGRVIQNGTPFFPGQMVDLAGNDAVDFVNESARPSVIVLISEAR